MISRTSVLRLSMLLAWLAWGSQGSARQPGYPEKVALGNAVLAIRPPSTGFLWLALASEEVGEGSGRDRLP